MTTTFATPDLTEREQPSRGHVTTPRPSKDARRYRDFIFAHENDKDLGKWVAMVISGSATDVVDAHAMLAGAYQKWREDRRVG